MSQQSNLGDQSGCKMVNLYANQHRNTPSIYDRIAVGYVDNKHRAWIP